MPAIHIDGIPIHVSASGASCVFNPSFAFSSRRAIGLRSLNSGLILLPSDGEGNIIVDAGASYSLVSVSLQEQVLLNARSQKMDKGKSERGDVANEFVDIVVARSVAVSLTVE